MVGRARVITRGEMRRGLVRLTVMSCLYLLALGWLPVPLVLVTGSAAWVLTLFGWSWYFFRMREQPGGEMRRPAP